MDTSGGIFTLKGTTPSNRYVDSVATSVTSEEVTFSLDGTFMSETGYYKHCYVEYRKDNQILTTQDIIFFSLGVSDISQGQADEYVSQLEELIQKYNETFDAFMAEIKGRVDSLNQQITDLTGQAKTLQEKLDALKEEISKLGNLQVMYSNSIDFGDYDYSTAPNLMRTITFSDLSTMATPTGRVPTGVTDKGDYFEIDLTTMGVNEVKLLWIPMAPRPQVGKQYTYSIELMCDEGEMNEVYIRPYFINADGTSGVFFDSITKTVTSTWKRYSRVTGKASDAMVNSTLQVLQLYFPSAVTRRKLYVRYNIMVQEGDQTSSQTTGWKPNLLDAPYYLSKVPLGENIADHTAVFPISTSDYQLYNKRNIENYEADQTYTLTMKATKPSIQSFRVFIMSGTQLVGTMRPVEGKVDEWEITFTVSQSAINNGATNILQVYQYPNTSLGAVKIEWLKLEKGDTRTPNIEQYKYRGIGMRDSNNPKDYVWDLAPEYVEDNLATDVKISEITGKANNYTDGKVSEINSQLTASINEVDKKVTANTKSITTINSTLTEMQKPVKYEAWFSGGTELRPANANSRFRVSEERLTIGTKLNVAMNESPLEWNADRWEATFTRECSILVDVQTMVEFADQWGTYVYINMWKDTNQTQTWDTGYGMGIASGANFWFRTELSVSMYCMNAKVGDKFSIGLGMASGKSLTSARIHKLHIMEL